MSQKEEKERDRGRRTEEGKLLFCLKLVELDMRNEWRMKKKRRVWYFIERIDELGSGLRTHSNHSDRALTEPLISNIDIH